PPRTNQSQVKSSLSACRFAERTYVHTDLCQRTDQGIRIILVELDIRSCTIARRRTESDAKFLPRVRSIWKSGYKSDIVHVENHSARETYKVVGHPRLSGLPFIQQQKISPANCFLNRHPGVPNCAGTDEHETGRRRW